MTTTYPTIKCQNHRLWRQYIASERRETATRVAALELRDTLREIKWFKKKGRFNTL